MPSASHIYEVRGEHVRVKDSLAVYLLVREELADGMLDERERVELLFLMVLEEPQQFADTFGAHATDALADVLWGAFGIDVNGDKPHEEQVMDWDEDHDRIVVTARSAYGMSFDDLKATQYREAAVLMGLAPHETPMGQALYYRLASPPKQTKYNKEEVKAFKKAREFYKLGKPSKGKGSIERMNAAATSEFDALAKRVTENGRK